MNTIIEIDLEATGLSIKEDRIIQIALKKFDPSQMEDGELTGDELSFYINPKKKMTSGALGTTGITDEFLADKPTFAEVFDDIWNFIGDIRCMAGHNIEEFDIPLLVAEINRLHPELGVKRSDFTCIDTMVIWAAQEGRDHGAAYRRFCGAEIEGQHDAVVDAKCNLEIIREMIKTYEIEPTADGLISAKVNPNFVVNTHHFQWGSHGEVRVCFGKHSGRTLEHAIASDNQYFKWIVFKSTFPLEVKEFVEKCLKDGVPVKELVNVTD